MHDIYIEVFEGIGREEQIVMAKEIGYKGYFSNPDYAHDLGALQNYRKLGEETGLIFETVHSSIPGCTDIWFPREEGDAYIERLLQQIDNCAAVSVPVIIVHVQANWRENPSFELGAKRYEKIVKAAKEKGVKIAFENANNEDFLCRMLDYFKDDHVGFCYDSGHEVAFSKGADFLSAVGNRLICTHLNDNDGKSDLHLLPFDGVIDFEKMASGMKKCGYTGNLTFELRYSEAYAKQYDKREFMEECYKRAIKFKEMIEK